MPDWNSPHSYVDRFAGRSGVSAEIVAVLMIVIGILVIVFPKLIAWFIGLLLIAAGVLWLITTFQARRSLAPASSPPPRVP